MKTVVVFASTRAPSTLCLQGDGTALVEANSSLLLVDSGTKKPHWYVAEKCHRMLCILKQLYRLGVDGGGFTVKEENAEDFCGKIMSGGWNQVAVSEGDEKGKLRCALQQLTSSCRCCISGWIEDPSGYCWNTIAWNRNRASIELHTSTQNSNCYRWENSCPRHYLRWTCLRMGEQQIRPTGMHAASSSTDGQGCDGCGQGVTEANLVQEDACDSEAETAQVIPIKTQSGKPVKAVQCAAGWFGSNAATTNFVTL